MGTHLALLKRCLLISGPSSKSFYAAFAPHQTAVATPIPGNIKTFAATAQPADSQPKEQGQKLM